MSYKYKVYLGGAGANVFIHNVTLNQFLLLQAIGDLNADDHYDQIMSILQKELPDDTCKTYLGLYNNEDLQLRVFDENENNVFENDANYQLQQINNYETDFIKVVIQEQSLIIADYSKGDFFVFDLEIAEPFNPDLITPVYTSIAEEIEIITSIRYDGIELVRQMDDNDFWSSGLYYYLNDI